MPRHPILEVRVPKDASGKASTPVPAGLTDDELTTFNDMQTAALVLRDADGVEYHMSAGALWGLIAGAAVVSSPMTRQLTCADGQVFVGASAHSRSQAMRFVPVKRSPTGYLRVLRDNTAPLLPEEEDLIEQMPVRDRGPDRALFVSPYPGPSATLVRWLLVKKSTSNPKVREAVPYYDGAAVWRKSNRTKAWRDKNPQATCGVYSATGCGSSAAGAASTVEPGDSVSQVAGAAASRAVTAGTAAAARRAVAGVASPASPPACAILPGHTWCAARAVALRWCVPSRRPACAVTA